MARLLAVRCGLLLFAASLVDGVIRGHDSANVLWDALGKMVAGWLLGFGCGCLARLLAEDLAQRQFDAWRAESDAASPTDG